MIPRIEKRQIIDVDLSINDVDLSINVVDLTIIDVVLTLHTASLPFTRHLTTFLEGARNISKAPP